MSVFNPETGKYEEGQPAVQPTAQGYATNTNVNGVNQTTFYNNPVFGNAPGTIDEKVIIDLKSNKGQSFVSNQLSNRIYQDYQNTNQRNMRNDFNQLVNEGGIASSQNGVIFQRNFSQNQGEPIASTSYGNNPGTINLLRNQLRYDIPIASSINGGTLNIREPVRKINPINQGKQQGNEEENKGFQSIPRLINEGITNFNRGEPIALANKGSLIFENVFIEYGNDLSIFGTEIGKTIGENAKYSPEFKKKLDLSRIKLLNGRTNEQFISDLQKSSSDAFVLGTFLIPTPIPIGKFGKAKKLFEITKDAKLFFLARGIQGSFLTTDIPTIETNLAFSALFGGSLIVAQKASKLTNLVIESKIIDYPKGISDVEAKLHSFESGRYISKTNKLIPVLSETERLQNVFFKNLVPTTGFFALTSGITEYGILNKENPELASKLESTIASYSLGIHSGSYLGEQSLKIPFIRSEYGPNKVNYVGIENKVVDIAVTNRLKTPEQIKVFKQLYGRPANIDLYKVQGIQKPYNIEDLEILTNLSQETRSKISKIAVKGFSIPDSFGRKILIYGSSVELSQTTLKITPKGKVGDIDSFIPDFKDVPGFNYIVEQINLAKFPEGITAKIRIDPLNAHGQHQFIDLYQNGKRYFGGTKEGKFISGSEDYSLLTETLSPLTGPLKRTTSSFFVNEQGISIFNIVDQLRAKVIGGYVKGRKKDLIDARGIYEGTNSLLKDQGKSLMINESGQINLFGGKSLKLRTVESVLSFNSEIPSLKPLNTDYSLNRKLGNYLIPKLKQEDYGSYKIDKKNYLNVSGYYPEKSKLPKLNFSPYSKPIVRINSYPVSELRVNPYSKPVITPNGYPVPTSGRIPIPYDDPTPYPKIRVSGYPGLKITVNPGPEPKPGPYPTPYPKPTPLGESKPFKLRPVKFGSFKSFGKGFNVFVKINPFKKGVFKQLNNNPVSYNKALSIGLRGVEGYNAPGALNSQTFEVRASNRLIETSKYDLKPNLERVYSSKKVIGRFIEKRKYAINTPSEKFGLKKGKKKGLFAW